MREFSFRDDIMLGKKALRHRIQSGKDPAEITLFGKYGQIWLYSAEKNLYAVLQYPRSAEILHIVDRPTALMWVKKLGITSNIEKQMSYAND